MRPFKDLPIARKAIILGLAPTICALVVASGAFLVSVFLSVRTNVAADVQTSAAMIADSINLAVSLDDAATVQELTGALREKSNIDRACVFDERGNLLSGYTREGEQCPLRPEREPPLRASQIHVD